LEHISESNELQKSAVKESLKRIRLSIKKKERKKSASRVRNIGDTHHRSYIAVPP